MYRVALLVQFGIEANYTALLRMFSFESLRSFKQCTVSVRGGLSLCKLSGAAQQLHPKLGIGMTAKWEIL